MRRFTKIAAACTVAGLTAFGAVVGTAGAAGAATNVSMTGCSDSGNQLLQAGLGARCTAAASSITFPTSINLTVNPSFFTVLLGNTVVNSLLGGALSVKVSYTLSCSVNGKTVTSTRDTGFTVSSASNNKHRINLQSAVGSPAPNKCTLANLTASSLIDATVLNSITKIIGVDFTFGVSAAADNGLGQPIYYRIPVGGGKVTAICADDRNNGNAGSYIQSNVCVNDPNQKWIQVNTHQWVHNGDCLSDVGGLARLALCNANPSPTNGQVWRTVLKTGGYELVSANGRCLTAPAPTKGGVTLKIAACKATAGQLWHVPGVTAP